MVQKRPSWVLNLALIGIGLVFALAVIGVVLLAFPQFRPNMMSFRVEQGDIFYHQAPWMRPPENMREVLATYWLAWDEEGFRIPHRRADTYTVVALGDSFTEAPNAPKPWPDVLADALDTPVRNLGFRGFGPREEMQAFELYGNPETVDIVVIGYFEGNDLSNAYSQRNAEFSPPANVTDRGMVPTDFSTITDRDERYPMQVELNGEAHDIAFLEGYIWALNAPVEVYAESRNLNLTRRNWAAIREMAPDACVVVAYFPDKGHIYLPYLSPDDRPILLQKATETYLNGDRVLTMREAPTTFEALLANLDNQRDAVQAITAELGLPMLDLTPMFEEAASNGEITYYTYDTHWNQRGHDLAGQAIADFLAAQPCSNGAQTQ